MSSLLLGLGLLLVQQGTVFGWVREETSREPVPFASVEVVGRGAVLADEHGYFVVTAVPSGAARVRASMIGYGTAETTVVVPPEGSVRLEILLPFRPIELEGIRAEADAEELDAARSPGPAPMRIDAPTLNLVPAMAEKDAFRALQLLPSVAAASDFSSALYVRGGSPDQNLVLLDGAPLFNPYHVGGLFSAIDPDAIATLEMMPGGLPAPDGDRASGVVKVWTRDGGRDRLRGHGALGLVSSRLGLDGPLPTKGGSYLVSARRTYFDVMTKAAHQLGFLDTSFPYSFTDAHAKITQDIGLTGRLNVSGYLNDERIRTPEEANDNTLTAFDWGTRAGSVSYRQPFGGAFLAEVTLAATSFDGDFDAVERYEGEPPDTSLYGRITMRDLVASAGVTWYGRGHSLRLGVQLDDYDFRYHFRIDDVVVTDPNRPDDGDELEDLFAQLGEAAGIRTVAAYLEDEWAVTDAVGVRLGLRALHAPDLGTELMPRLGVRWALTPRVALTAAGGRYAQAIHSLRDEESVLASIVPYELLVPASEETGYLVAEDVTAGIEYRTRDTRLRADGYYKRYPSLPTPPLAGDPQDAPIFATDFLPGTGRASGLELFAQHRTGPFTLMGSYALGWNERSADGIRYTPRYSRTHLLDVTGAYAWGGTGILTGRLAAGTGQPYTPALSRIPVFLTDPITGDYVRAGDRIVLGDHNSERLPGYLRVDLGVRKELSRHWFGRDVTLTPYAQVLNVLGNRNVTAGRPVYNHLGEGELEYLPALPLLPTFGIEWRF